MVRLDHASHAEVERELRDDEAVLGWLIAVETDEQDHGILCYVACFSLEQVLDLILKLVARYAQRKVDDEAVARVLELVGVERRRCLKLFGSTPDLPRLIALLDFVLLLLISRRIAVHSLFG